MLCCPRAFLPETNATCIAEFARALKGFMLFGGAGSGTRARCRLHFRAAKLYMLRNI
jgi:hypothetical protein